MDMLYEGERQTIRQLQLLTLDGAVLFISLTQFPLRTLTYAHSTLGQYLLRQCV